MRTIIRDRLSGNDRVTIGADERLTYVFFLDQERDPDRDLEFRLAGRNSSACVVGFAIGIRGRSRLSVRFTHDGANTEGFAWLKSVLGGDARSEVSGMIRIEKGASAANACFTHKSLLLSLRAKVTTSPALEIGTNDVRVQHAATVGRLDEETLFYLHARSIEPAAARHLVTTSFASEYVDKIEDARARETVGALVRGHVGRLA